MLDVILKYWVTWLCGLIAAGLLAAVRKLWQRQKAVERGIQALLRDRLVQAYYHYQEQGYTTLHGLENINAMYEQYHALGGNGTVTKLVNAMRELDVQDD